MPRDSSGNYLLPAGNPVASGTVVSTTWANPTMEDLGREITNSLDRNGRGGMLVPFKFADGSVVTPSITFTSEPGSGIYRALNNDIRMGITGRDTTRWINASASPAGSQVPFEIWDGVAWRPVMYAGGALTGILPNNVFLQSQNGAGDGQVDLIRAAANDDIIIGNVSTSVAVTTSLDFYPSSIMVMANNDLTDSNQFVVGAVDLTTPQIMWATGDTQSFDRVTNTFVWNVGGVNKFLISETAVTTANPLIVDGTLTVDEGGNATSVFIQAVAQNRILEIRADGNFGQIVLDGNSDFRFKQAGVDWLTTDVSLNVALPAGSLNVSGRVTAGDGVLTVDGGFYLEAVTATLPILVFDANDYIGYERSNDTFSLNQNGIVTLAADANNDVTIPNGGLLVGVATSLALAHWRIGANSAIVTTDNNNNFFFEGPAGVNQVGTFSVMSSDAAANGIGGSIILGGKYTGDTPAAFAKISGVQTANSFSGAMQLATRNSVGTMVSAIEIDDTQIVRIVALTGVGTRTVLAAPDGTLSAP